MTIQAQPISPLAAAAGLAPGREPATPSHETRNRRSAWAGRQARRLAHDPDDRPTVDVQTQDPSAINVFALLDHRTTARSLPLQDAPPGRYLSVEDGDDVRLIPLEKPIVHIGRGLSADVRLEDPQVSRRHAIIAQRGDGARVLDDRSSNGTHVNGREVTVGYLADGDVLRLGRVVMRFVEIAPPVRVQPVRRMPLAAIARRQVGPAAA